MTPGMAAACRGSCTPLTPIRPCGLRSLAAAPTSKLASFSTALHWGNENFADARERADHARERVFRGRSVIRPAVYKGDQILLSKRHVRSVLLREFASHGSVYDVRCPPAEHRWIRRP
jgi:hypothetical protein